jgi:hypothetical protein
MKVLTKKLFFVVVSLVLLSAASASLAQTTGCPTIEFKLSTPLPGVKEITQVDCASIGNYIVQLFTFGVYVAGFLSAIVMMIGGFLWLTAGGNSTQVSTAKSFFGGGLSGFVLILVSWTLLNTINPNLVKFKPLNITPISSSAPLTTGCQNYANKPDDLEAYAYVVSDQGKCGAAVEGTQCYCAEPKSTAVKCCYSNRTRGVPSSCGTLICVENVAEVPVNQVCPSAAPEEKLVSQSGRCEAELQAPDHPLCNLCSP